MYELQSKIANIENNNYQRTFTMFKYNKNYCFVNPFFLTFIFFIIKYGLLIIDKE